MYITHSNLDLGSAVINIVRLLAIGGSLYFFVGIIINLFQAQLSSTVGDHIGYSHAVQQVLGLTFLLAIVGATYPISRSIQPGLEAISPDQMNSVTIFWTGLARVVVSFILGAAVMGIFVKAAFSVMGGQFGYLIGSPGAVTRSIMGFTSTVGGGILTILSVWMANTLITYLVGG